MDHNGVFRIVRRLQAGIRAASCMLQGMAFRVMSPEDRPLPSMHGELVADLNNQVESHLDRAFPLN